MIDSNALFRRSGISSIVTPCSARKEKLPTPGLRLGQLPLGTQRAVAKSWVKRLSESSDQGRLPARDLYSGRGFRRMRSVADEVDCQLFVLSAGLGFVASTSLVPSYDLTVSPSASTSLQYMLTDVFAPEAWWDALQAGPFASSLAEMGHGEGRILIALTQPYAALVGPALAALSPAIRVRMRLFGAGVLAHLPELLHTQIVRYDTRLDAVAAGTRLDASSRALAHFAELIAHSPIGVVESDQALVDSALAHVVQPVVIKRPRVSDADLRQHILLLARRGMSATNALKHLRSEVRVACQEQRFRRVYEEVVA